MSARVPATDICLGAYYVPCQARLWQYGYGFGIWHRKMALRVQFQMLILACFTQTIN